MKMNGLGQVVIVALVILGIGLAFHYGVRPHMSATLKGIQTASQTVPASGGFESSDLEVPDLMETGHQLLVRIKAEFEQ